MVRIFSDGPEPPSRFNPYNPLGEEIALIRNAILITRVAMLPVMLAFYLIGIGWILGLLFRSLDAMGGKMIGSRSPPATDLQRRSKGCRQLFDRER